MTTTSHHELQRVALVAGASRGIGADTAKAFVRAGYAVVLGAHGTDALERAVDEIEAQGGRAVSQGTSGLRRIAKAKAWHRHEAGRPRVSFHGTAQ